MATFTNVGGRVRAQIRLKGAAPVARTFATLEEANEWADEQERAIREERQSRGWTSVRQRELERIMGDPERMSAAQIVASAAPVACFIGVYVLIRRGAIVYVGMSNATLYRVGQHWKNGVDFDSYRMFECADMAEAAVLESKLIEKHRPPLNVLYPSLPHKAEAAA